MSEINSIFSTMKVWIVSVIFSVCFLQDVNPWKLLADVDFKIKRSEKGYEVPYPVFGEQSMSLKGKTISLRGYIIPLEEIGDQNYFMFSSLPFSSCFFCGGAGPETVIEVYSSESIGYSANLLEIEGKLELNNDDPDHHMYILRNAKLK